MIWTRTLVSMAILWAAALGGPASHASPMEPDAALPIQVTGRVALDVEVLRPRQHAAALRALGIQAQSLGLLGSGRSVAVVLQVSESTAESIDWIVLMTTGDIAKLLAAVVAISRAGQGAAELGDSIGLARVRLATGGASERGLAGFAIAALAGGLSNVECAALEAECEGRPVARGAPAMTGGGGAGEGLRR